MQRHLSIAALILSCVLFASGCYARIQTGPGYRGHYRQGPAYRGVVVVAPGRGRGRGHGHGHGHGHQAPPPVRR